MRLKPSVVMGVSKLDARHYASLLQTYLHGITGNLSDVGLNTFLSASGLKSKFTATGTG